VTSPRHKRISDIFLKACDLVGEKRREFLAEVCAGDPELRSEVDSLLDHEADGSRLFESGAGAVEAVGVLLKTSRDPAVSAKPAQRKQVACPNCGASIPPEQKDCPLCRTRTGEFLAEVPLVPGFKILRLLGEGGMGKVYLAEETALGRRVAIKMIWDVLAADERMITRFMREARLMASVEHPHIVRVYSFGQNEGRSYLVMEYVEGESLSRRLRRIGRIGADEALRILRQTVEALGAAWEHRIIHRDIKPSNLLMDTEDNVRVADFGLARATQQMADSSITQTGMMLGTPHYVSPEQARGEKDLDFRSDLYSLGIMLYELLAGQPPYEGATPVAVMDQHLHAPLPSLKTACPEVSGELEQLCEWMTRKQPADRPASYAELEQSIDALLGRVAPGMGAQTLPAFLQRGIEEDDEITGSVFVGRKEELNGLDDALERALSGQGQVVFVKGETGSGKTALVAEFARRAQGQQADLIVAGGNCNAQTGRGDPYLPFRQVLGLLTADVEAKKASGALTVDHARRLWGLLPLSAQALVERGPDLVGTFISGASLISRAAAHTPSPTSWRVRLEELAKRNATLPPDVNLQQSYLFEQYTRTLQALAQHQPLLIHLEDLQWADEGSCNLLFHLGLGIAGSRVLVVGTYRPAEVALEREGQRHPLQSVVNELRRRFGEFEVGLDEEGTQEFVDELLDSEPNELDSQFREAFYRHTRGHPLFASELLRSMREHEMLVRNDQDHWVEGPSLDWATLPARVEGAIGERIERLPENLREVLSLASVQGEEFNAEVLAEVQGSKQREVVGLLSRELDKRHRLVSAQGLKRFNGQRVSTYRFRHILFQKYLYGQVDEVERGYLHEEVGAALEKIYGDHVDEVAVQLARHFHEAGIPPKTILYLKRAGNNAVRLSANTEAIAHLAQALGLLRSLPNSPETAREELDLRLAFGAPLMATAGPGSSELGEAYTRARELCGQVGDAPQLFQSLFLLVHHHASKGELSTTLELADQLLDVTDKAEEPLPLIMACWARGFALFFLGRFPEAREEFERVISMYEFPRDRALAFAFGMDPGVSALSLQSLALWFLGFPTQSRKHRQKALALARRVEHPSSEAHALTLASFLAVFGHDPGDLKELTGPLVQLSVESGIVLFRAWARFLQGWLVSKVGKPEEGIEQMQQGRSAIQACGSQLSIPTVLGSLAEAFGETGRIDEGLGLISEAIEQVARSDERVLEAELHRIKGELLLRQGASAADDAEACFERAIEAARRQEAKSWELRATTSLAELWREQGKRDEARQRLAEVFGWFTEGSDGRDHRKAKSLLDALS